MRFVPGRKTTVMSKKLFLVMMCTTVLLNGFGQNNFMVGIEAGAGISKGMASDSAGDAYDYDLTVVPLFGLNAEYRVNDLVSVRSGIYYETKRSTYTNSFNFGFIAFDIENKTSFGYLTVPLAVNFSFGQTPRFFLGAGPNISFLISQKSETTVSGVVNSHTETNDKDLFKPVDLGLVLNAGVGIPIAGQYELSFNLRDNLGLMNMFKDKSRYGELRYNMFYLTAGFSVWL